MAPIGGPQGQDPLFTVVGVTGGDTVQVHTVVGVTGGDTVQVQGPDGVQAVRLLGADTPEPADARGRPDVAGLAARAHTQKLLMGKRVYIRPDAAPGAKTEDARGNRLGYVYRADDHLDVNKDLLEQGFGRADATMPLERLGELRRAEEAAKAAGRGVHARPTATPKPRGAGVPGGGAGAKAAMGEPGGPIGSGASGGTGGGDGASQTNALLAALLEELRRQGQGGGAFLDFPPGADPYAGGRV